MKKIISILLAASLCVCLFGCAAKTSEHAIPAESTAPAESASPEAEYKIDEIVIGTTGLIETATRGEYNYDMMASGTSELPLLYQDTDGEFHPLLADFSSESASVWTYTVRGGLLWDDGEPVTAEDILFTLQYEDSEGRANFTEHTDAEGKTTAAKYTAFELSEDKMSITLTLASPNVREPGNMTSFRVMPKHVYEGKTEVSESDARIGCGPYKFESFNREAGTVTFTACETYPEKPNVGRIVYKLFGNEDTMYMALQNGDIDMVWSYSYSVPITYAEVLGDTVTVEAVPAANVPAVLAFNNAKGFFADENMRRAASLALDYSVFRTYFGSAFSEIPCAGFVPPSTVGSSETDRLKTDADEAAKIMEAAGYTKNSDGIYENDDGRKAEFTLTFNSEKEAQAGCAELIKTQLEAFGIAVTLDGADKDTYNSKTSNKFSENNITMEAAIFGYTSAGMGMGGGLGSIYVDGSHAVQGGCQVFDDEFKAALTALGSAETLDEYCDAAKTVQEYYASHLPLVALYWDNITYAYGASFENITLDGVFGLNNVRNWFSITSK